MVPYLLNHSSKMSYPEKVVQDFFEEKNIEGWKYNYSVGRYVLDFAFPLLKIDIEIDGGTHLLESVIIKDKNRDEFLLKNGWKILRITAKELKNDMETSLNKIVDFLNAI